MEVGIRKGAWRWACPEGTLLTEVSIRCKKTGGWYTAYTRVYPPIHHWAGPYANNLHFASDKHTGTSSLSFFTERMLFLMQHQHKALKAEALKAVLLHLVIYLWPAVQFFPYTFMCSFVYRNQRPTHPVCFLGFSFTLYLFYNLKLISISLCKLLINRSLYDTTIS